MQKRSKKLLAFLLCLVMVLSAFPMGVLAADAAVFTKVEVTSASDITAGTYLIYGTSSQVTDDGSASAFMTTSGSTETRLMSSSFEISNGSVSTSDSASFWKLISTEGGFYIQNEGNAKYL